MEQYRITNIVHILCLISPITEKTRRILKNKNKLTKTLLFVVFEIGSNPLTFQLIETQLLPPFPLSVVFRLSVGQVDALPQLAKGWMWCGAGSKINKKHFLTLFIFIENTVQNLLRKESVLECQCSS